MNHRDQLFLALEMQNGVLDKFVQERMAYMEMRQSMSRSDDRNYRAWLMYGGIEVTESQAELWHEERFAQRAAAS